MDQVVILIVCYNGRQHLNDCCSSILNSDDSDIDKQIVMVDNGSTDGSSDYVRSYFPQVDLIVSDKNLGFAGGNNLGWEHIQHCYPQAKTLCLLNQDTLVESGWLRTLVDFLNLHPEVGAVQPKIRLHPQVNKINTIGNRCHYLAFGFTMGLGDEDRGQYDQQRSIDFASGAALAVRTDLLLLAGLFDSQMFMYLEDTELSWKLRLIGYDIHFIPESVVYHKQSPGAPLRYYYYLERNRWLLLARYYKLLTLILLTPALLFMEVGQLLFAMTHSLLRDRLRVYAYFLRPDNLKNVATRRREIQRRRLVGDRDFMTRFSGKIHSEAIDSPALRFIANPLLNTYWQLVRRLIFW